MSGVEPAANGTTIVTWAGGHCAVCAEAGSASDASASAANIADFMGSPRPASVSPGSIDASAQRSSVVERCQRSTAPALSGAVGQNTANFTTPAALANTIAASYVRVTQRTDWQQGGLSKASAWTVGTNLTWSPVRGFDIGLELSYARLKQNLTGLNGAAPSLANVAAACVGGIGGGGAAAGVCGGNPLNFKISPNVWNARLRVERNF